MCDGFLTHAAFGECALRRIQILFAHRPPPVFPQHAHAACAGDVVAVCAADPEDDGVAVAAAAEDFGGEGLFVAEFLQRFLDAFGVVVGQAPAQ